jgi:hypothetical protein
MLLGFECAPQKVHMLNFIIPQIHMLKVFGSGSLGSSKHQMRS